MKLYIYNENCVQAGKQVRDSKIEKENDDAHDHNL